MTDDQKQVRDWMKAFGQECPEKPTIPSLEVRKLRAKLILEEALETINALGFRVMPYYVSNNIFPELILEESNSPNLLEITDGCEDLKVVTEGTLVACGLVNTKLHKDCEGYENESAKEFDPLFDEVMRSNYSKFWNLFELVTMAGDEELGRAVNFGSHTWINGLAVTKIAEDKYLVKDSSGKVIKSPSYSPANLQPIIESLS